MSKLLIVSDSFTEHMAVLSYPNYKKLIVADEIVLLGENHNTKELKILNTVYHVSLVDCIEHFDGDKLLVFGDNSLLQKITNRITPQEFMLMPNPYNYTATDLTLRETDINQFSSLPTILILTFSSCSNIVNVELLLERVFREKNVELERYYLDNTSIILDSMYERCPENMSDYYFQPYKPQAVIKSIYWDEQVLKKLSFSQIIAYFEKVNPDYTILCLDSDLASNEIHCEIFNRIFGKTPNVITHSPYYIYQHRDDLNIKVLSQNSEETIISEWMKQDEWINKMISKLSLPINIDIL